MAVAQVQINAVNTVGRVKGKVLKPIEKHGEECCQTIPDIKYRIDLDKELSKKPESWTIWSETIVLAVTHLPCPNCLATITSSFYKLKPRLILRVANIRYEKATVDSLFELDRAGIIVELHPISVTAELGMVYCKRHASQAEQQQWKLAKLQRPQYDIDAAENVRLINIELSRRKFVEQVRWFAHMGIALFYSFDPYNNIVWYFYFFE